MSTAPSRSWFNAQFSREEFEKTVVETRETQRETEREKGWGRERRRKEEVLRKVKSTHINLLG